MHCLTPATSPSRVRNSLHQYLLRRIQLGEWHYIGVDGDNLLTMIAVHAFNDLATLLLRCLPQDFNQKSLRPDGATPVIIAAMTGNFDLIEQMMTHSFCRAQINQPSGCGVTPLIIAVFRCDSRMAKTLLHFGAFVDGRLPDESTPLMHACKHGDPVLIKVLLSYSPDVNTVDHNNLNAVAYAVCNNQFIALPLLHRLGAQLDTKDARGNTPLMQAIKCNAAASAMWLIENHVDINQLNHKKHSALMIAVINNCEQAIALLLKRPELVINQVDDYQQTALMYACMHGRTTMVKALISHPNLNIHLSNICGETAVTLAASYNHCETLSLLLKQPLPHDRQDAIVLDCLRIARKNQFMDVIDMILNCFYTVYRSDQTRFTQEGQEILDYYRHFSGFESASGMRFFNQSSASPSPARKKITPIQKKMERSRENQYLQSHGILKPAIP